MIPEVKFSTQHNILQVIISIIMIETHAQAIITSIGFNIKVFLLFIHAHAVFFYKKQGKMRLVLFLISLQILTSLVLFRICS